MQHGWQETPPLDIDGLWYKDRYATFSSDQHRYSTGRCHLHVLFSWVTKKGRTVWASSMVIKDAKAQRKRHITNLTLSCPKDPAGQLPLPKHFPLPIHGVSLTIIAFWVPKQASRFSRLDLAFTLPSLTNPFPDSYGDTHSEKNLPPNFICGQEKRHFWKWVKTGMPSNCVSLWPLTTS